MAQVRAESEDDRLLRGWPQRMGIEIAVPGWHAPVCAALRRVLMLPPAQAHLHRGVLAHAAEYGELLARDARDQEVSRDLRPDQFPMASFLLALPRRLQPVERTLAWLILEAHLCGSQGKLVVALAQIMRGLSRGGGSKLAHTIVECSGPSQLLAKMSRLGDESPDLGLTGHRRFDALWRDELHPFCIALVQQAECLPELDGAEASGGPLDQPGAFTESPLGGPGEDPDEGSHDPSVPTDPGMPIPKKRVREAIDWSVHMSRRSSPDLLRAAENVLPPRVRERQWRDAVHAAEQALAEADLAEMEYKVLAVLSIETGLSAREALATAFGTSASAKCPAIDLGAQALRRPEVMPPNSFLPKEGDDRWLPAGGDAIFPISRTCVRLLEDLREARLRRSPGPRSSLLLSSRTDPGGAPVPRDGVKLRAATGSSHRLVLAIGLADALGVDAAQRAFGDSFGLSAAPVFYGVYPAAELARVVASINPFADHDPRVVPWMHAASHVLGSRVRPRDPPYARAWAKLQGEAGRGKGRPSDRRLASEWRSRRDRLLVHFLLATGVRPSKDIGEMTLHDFLPRHAMAVVADKQVDPLHHTRLVCTGWRFVGELEGFIIELARISRRSGDAQAKDLASSILAGTTSLFATPPVAGDPVPGILALLAELDPLWGERPNLHRHGLCQYLIQKGIDPELRYFQMGWMCHDHHATSESAPYATTSLGDKLGHVLDGWLDTCGWMGGAVPKDPTTVLPMRALIDWKPRQRAHEQSGQTALATLRADLRESERGLEDRIWREICDQAQKVLPHFDSSGTPARPAFKQADGVADGKVTTINHVDVEQLLAPFAKASRSAVERYVAVRVLHKALLRTAKETGARVYLPPVPVLSKTRVPSPFLRGAGLAVAQVDFLQSRLIQHVRGHDESVAPLSITELIAAAAVSILLHTPCMTLGAAVEILEAAARGCHADTEAWQLRVPFGRGHVVLRGDCAILVSRLLRNQDLDAVREGQSRNKALKIGRFLAKLAPALASKPGGPSGFVERLEATVRVAKLIRCNGPERLLLREAAIPALVSAKRAVSVADGITITGFIPLVTRGAASVTEPPGSTQNPSHRPQRDVSSVMKAFDDEFIGDIMGTPARTVAERRPQLRRLLEDALSRMGKAPMSGRLLLEYAWHLLMKGGPRSSGGQAIATVRKAYYRLEPMLRGVGPDKALDTLTSVEITAVCRFACGKARRKSSREVLGEFRRFMAYATRRYRVPEPDWDALYREYGKRIRGGDPALVSDHEAALVLERLHGAVLDLEGTDADPAERRFREVCFAAALIAEASGARPRSVHGLTLGDLVLDDEADYIRLRSHGRFASVKTSTSVGYVPFEGELWHGYRPWFARWLRRICSTLPEEDLGMIPLFQVPGEAIGVRYERNKVFRTLGELIRWSTQHGRGRSYWFRKRRVRARHIRVLSVVGSTARDMAKAMRCNGHALMITPMASYLCEEGAFVSGDLSLHAVSSKSGSIALAGIVGHRRSRTSHDLEVGSHAHVARLIRLGPALHQAATRPSPPKLPRYGGDLAWSSVERIMRDLARGEERDWVAAHHDVEVAQVDSIAGALQALTARLKVEIGPSASQLGPSRQTAELGGWYERLEKADPRIGMVALDWVDVSSPASFRVGCELNADRAVSALIALCGELRLTCEEAEGRFGTRLLRFPEGGRAQYGAWPTIRWILAAAWVAEFRSRGRAKCHQTGAADSETRPKR